MRHSMTAYASAQGSAHGFAWTWDLRGVNGKGLEMRMRLPDWIDGLETNLKKTLSSNVLRGSIHMSLKLVNEAGDSASRLDPAQLGSVLHALAQVQTAARDQGITLTDTSAAEILALKGVMTTDAPKVDPKPLLEALTADFLPVVESFCAMRASEGQALAQILSNQLDEIASLVVQASEAAALRPDSIKARLRAQVSRLLDTGDTMDEARLTQELALLAVKSDITEELDRLRTHVDAARALLETEGAVGRKLDFLCQEFNREANTLCSKSGDAALTNIGLSLKTAIDQMREQIQNVE